MNFTHNLQYTKIEISFAFGEVKAIKTENS